MVSAAGGAPAAEDLRFVAREGGAAGVLGLVGTACRYVNAILLARVLGPGPYGLFALANTVVSFAAMAGNMGLPVSTVHFVAAGAGSGRWDAVRWVLRTALRLVLVSSVAWTVLIMAAAPFVAGTVFEKEGLAFPLAGLALSLPLFGVNAVAASGLQGLRQIRAKVILERIAHPLAFSVLLLGGFVFRAMGYVLACYVAAALAVAVLGSWWLARSVRTLAAEPAADTGGTVASSGRLRALLRFATPVLFLNLLNYLILWSDVLLMGVFRSAAEVGVYHVASRLAIAVNMPTESLNTSLAPSYAEAHGRGDRDGLTRMYHTSTRWIFTLSAAIFLVLVFGGPALLALFGSEFVAGYLAVCLLASGQLVSAACGTNGMLLTMTGRPHVNLVNAALLGVANLGLMLALVPRYGAAGAALSAATSWVIVNLARTVEIWFIFRVIPWDRTFLKPLLAFILACAAGGAALLALGPVAGALAASAALGGTLVLLGLEPDDQDLLRRVRARLRRTVEG